MGVEEWLIVNHGMCLCERARVQQRLCMWAGESESERESSWRSTLTTARRRKHHGTQLLYNMDILFILLTWQKVCLWLTPIPMLQTSMNIKGYILESVKVYLNSYSNMEDEHKITTNNHFSQTLRKCCLSEWLFACFSDWNCASGFNETDTLVLKEA